jgi:hypothetical protein
MCQLKILDKNLAYVLNSALRNVLGTGITVEDDNQYKQSHVRDYDN